MNAGVRGEAMTVNISSVAPMCVELRQTNVCIYVSLSKGPGMNGHDPLHMARYSAIPAVPKMFRDERTVDCGIRRVASELVCC